MSQLFKWGDQSIGVSASTSVLPMNTQHWSPLGWTGWISLQSKGLSRVFSIPRPWDSPGKNTGVGCHFLLQCMKVKSESEVAQSCPTLATPWTAAYQAPPSMGFSRQKYWRQRLFPSLKSRFAHVTCVSQGWCWKWNYVGSKLGLMRVCWFYRFSDSCSAAMRISLG